MSSEKEPADRSAEREERLIAALALALSDCRVMVHAYWHDARPPSAVVARCSQIPVDCTAGARAVADGEEVR